MLKTSARITFAYWLAPWLLVSLQAAAAVTNVRLYAIDCGQMTFKDMSMFSDSGAYQGKSGRLIDPCFVIQHPKGVMIWDTGLGDALVGHDEPANAAGVSLHVQQRLVDALHEINVSPADVSYVAFSHFHSDHTGNANLFTHATWLLNKAELQWAEGTPTPPVVDLKTFDAYHHSKVKMIGGDYDVFGDGTVTILSTPGHTPGHQALEIKLLHTGPVLLSGDLYHLRTDRPGGAAAQPQVMTMNVDKAASLASVQRIESKLRADGARLIIQHDVDDFTALPKFPAYLD